MYTRGKDGMNYDRMPRVAFFTYTEWAFGSIHKALCKELYKCGIQADIIDWNRQYSRDEFKFLLDTYDTFVTTPSNAPQILHTYGVPWGKMILIAHGREDIQMCAQEYIIPYNFLKGYGVIAKNLVETIRGYNIDCDVKVLQNGVSFDTFYKKKKTGMKNFKCLSVAHGSSLYVWPHSISKLLKVFVILILAKPCRQKKCDVQLASCNI